MASVGVPEDIIREIGGCGRYQITLGIVMHAMKATVVWSMFTMIFAAATPKWWCVDDITSDVIHTSNWTEVTDGVMVSNLSVVNSSLLKSCTNLRGQACQNIVYDYSMKTIYNDWELACNKDWVPATIASVQMAGLFFGHFVSGHLADTFGRKVPMMLALIMILAFNLVAYFSTSWILLAVARALIGCGMAFYLTIQYSLVAEVSLIKWRAINIIIPTWPVEVCIFALVGYFVPDWRILSLISGLSAIPFMASWWFVPESFRWYLSHERLSDARRIVNRIAKFNGKSAFKETELDEHLLNIKSTTDTEKGDDKHYTILDLFRTREMFKISFVCALNWFSLGLTGYGISFGIQALSGNFFMNMITFSAIGIVPSILVIYLSDRMGRRRTCILIFVLKAASSLTVGIVQYIDMDEVLRARLTNGFAMFCSVANSMAWGAVQTVSIELYPTVVRNIGYGFLNMCARCGAVLGPQFAYLDTQLGGFMYFFISAVATSCAIGTFFLQETSRADLKDRI